MREYTIFTINVSCQCPIKIKKRFTLSRDVDDLKLLINRKINWIFDHNFKITYLDYTLATHQNFIETNKYYFITFTCYERKDLISESNCYAAFYRWFKYLKPFNILTIGFVIMPNHFHGIFFIPHDCNKSINQVLSNGKRFLAYEIINKLQLLKKVKILEELNEATSLRERRSGKRHRVFKTSSDIKEIYSLEMLIKKLDYIHHNPCKGKWQLVDDFRFYKYSSAAFYELNADNEYIVDYRIVG